MLILQSILTLAMLNLLMSSVAPITALSMVALLIGLAAFVNYLKSWNHTLLMLLTLEVFMLTNTLLLGILCSAQMLTAEILFAFFTLAVCEASLGVAILICYSRQFGSDMLVSNVVL